MTGFLSLVDHKLRETFDRKPYDPEKDRAAMNKRLDTAHNQFIATEPARGKKMFKIQNGVVVLTLPFAIGGKTEFELPSERFIDALSALKAEITAGDHDAALKGDGDGGEAPVTRRGGPTGKRGPLSPEALEARRAKMAAAGTKGGPKKP